MKSFIRKNVIFTLVIINFIGLGIYPCCNCKSNYTQQFLLVEVDDDALPEWYIAKNHTTNIQDAINMVAENGTVYVHKNKANGYYYIGRESLIILKNLKLIGEEPQSTKIRAWDSSQNGFGILIKSRFVTIKNFTIYNAYTHDTDNENLAAIKIILTGKNNKVNISIKNNHIINNENGIINIAQHTNPDNVIINISNNIIENNQLRGIVCFGDPMIIYNNTITNSGWDGISIWGTKNCLISHNTISQNKGIGIWNDKGDNIHICNNEIYHNRNGVVVWSEDKIDTPDNNQIYRNKITNNKEYGMIIGEAHNNNVFNNTFLTNKKSGLIIKYGSLSCDGNCVFHNNFIRNGPYGSENTRVCNAVDNSNETNIWYNNDMKSGNYWDDYEQRTGYTTDHFQPHEYKMKWNELEGFNDTMVKYYFSYCFILNIYFKFTHEYINIHIPFDFKTTSSDIYPWIRMNGWCPQGPNPSTDFGFTNEDEYSIRIYANTTDPNDDKIIYQFQIKKWDNDKYINITGWDNINSMPVLGGSKQTYPKNLDLYGPGNFTIFYRAYDSCAGESYGSNGFDGCTYLGEKICTLPCTEIKN